MAGIAQDISPLQGGRVAPSLIAAAPLVEVSAGGFRWHVAAEHRCTLLGPRGLRLDEWLKTGQARIVKKGPHRVVYRVELPDLCFYIKRNLVTDRWCWIRQLLRPSKARTEYERA